MAFVSKHDGRRLAFRQVRRIGDADRMVGGLPGILQILPAAIDQLRNHKRVVQIERDVVDAVIERGEADGRLREFARAASKS